LNGWRKEYVKANSFAAATLLPKNGEKVDAFFSEPSRNLLSKYLWAEGGDPGMAFFDCRAYYKDLAFVTQDVKLAKKRFGMEQAEEVEIGRAGCYTYTRVATKKIHFVRVHQAGAEFGVATGKSEEDPNFAELGWARQHYSSQAAWKNRTVLGYEWLQDEFRAAFNPAAGYYQVDQVAMLRHKVDGEEDPDYLEYLVVLFGSRSHLVAPWPGAADGAVQVVPHAGSKWYAIVTPGLFRDM
jgi:hypothetical protein